MTPKKCLPALPRATTDKLGLLLEGCTLLSGDGLVLYQNPAAARHFRSQGRDLLGRCLLEAYPGLDRTPLPGGVRRCLEDQAGQQFEADLRLLGPGLGWLEFRLEPVPEGVLLLTRDLSGQKSADLELYRLYRALQTISACNQAQMHALDEPSLLLEVCRILVERGGYRLAWIGLAGHEEGRPVHPVAHFGLTAGYLETLNVSWADTERGQGPTGTAIRTGKVTVCRDTRTDDAFAPWRAAALQRGFAATAVLPLLDEGRAFAALSIYAADAEAFNPAELELLVQLAEELAFGVLALRARAAHSALERRMLQSQKLESLGLLGGGIAHDFNNLLGAIMGNLDLIQLDFQEDERGAGYVRAAMKASRAAAGLCRQMLTFAGHSSHSLESVGVNHLVEEMGQMLAVSIPKKIALTLELAPELPPVWADASQLRQVLMNLVVNAGDAIGAQSGRILLRSGVLRGDRAFLQSLWCGEDLPEGEYVFLEVSDTGCGMDAGTQARIFDPFFTTKATGRGLGLAAVLGIVRGHHGSIEVHSLVGAGTTFRILLPSAGAPREVRPLPPLGPAWQGSGTLLLVDDEPCVREVGQLLLRHLGFETIIGEDGQEALALFQTHRQVLRGIILDLTMPRMDGLETLRGLRELGCAVPVILASGNSEPFSEALLRNQGFAGFLQKPYTIHDLAAQLAPLPGLGA